VGSLKPPVAVQILQQSNPRAGRVSIDADSMLKLMLQRRMLGISGIVAHLDDPNPPSFVKLHRDRIANRRFGCDRFGNYLRVHLKARQRGVHGVLIVGKLSPGRRRRPPSSDVKDGD
jgi:hypothetical protein